MHCAAAFCRPQAPHCTETKVRTDPTGNYYEQGQLGHGTYMHALKASKTPPSPRSSLRTPPGAQSSRCIRRCHQLQRPEGRREATFGGVPGRWHPQRSARTAHQWQLHAAARSHRGPERPARLPRPRRAEPHTSLYRSLGAQGHTSTQHAIRLHMPANAYPVCLAAPPPHASQSLPLPHLLYLRPRKSPMSRESHATSFA